MLSRSVKNTQRRLKNMRAKSELVLMSPNYLEYDFHSVAYTFSYLRIIHEHELLPFKSKRSLDESIRRRERLERELSSDWPNIREGFADVAEPAIAAVAHSEVHKRIFLHIFRRNHVRCTVNSSISLF